MIAKDAETFFQLSENSAVDTDSIMMYITPCKTKAILLEEETKQDVVGQMGSILGL